MPRNAPALPSVICRSLAAHGRCAAACADAADSAAGWLIHGTMLALCAETLTSVPNISIAVADANAVFRLFTKLKPSDMVKTPGK
jgi:hypothetical protein